MLHPHSSQRGEGTHICSILITNCTPPLRRGLKSLDFSHRVHPTPYRQKLNLSGKELHMADSKVKRMTFLPSRKNSFTNSLALLSCLFLLF